MTLDEHLANYERLKVGRVTAILGTQPTIRLRVLKKDGKDSDRWVDMYAGDKWEMVSEPVQ